MVTHLNDAIMGGTVVLLVRVYQRESEMKFARAIPTV
jgi:hypothetical protein